MTDDRKVPPGEGGAGWRNASAEVPGAATLPDDLVAPLGGADCCGTIWLAPVADVIAATEEAPLVSPCCGRQWRLRSIERIVFVSRAEWEATDDDGPAPATYYLIREPA